MDYRIDYGTLNVTPSARPADVPLYASVEGRVASLANDEVLFYDPATDRNHVMTAQVLQALALCREFHPLDVHVGRVADGIPGLKGQEAAVRRVLEGLAGRGLLITDDAFLLGFQRAPKIELAPPTAIFIRAHERPAQLERLLQSLAEHVKRFGTAYRVVVVDDSTSSESQRAHAELLRHFGDASGCRTAHFDAARWAAMADALAAQLPEHAGALRGMLQRDRRYAGRRGGGIGKNLITLLAAGERYLLLDDDFVFPLRRHPEHAGGIGFDARAWAVRSFAAHDAALHAGVEFDGDPLALQLALCGQSVGAALGAVDGFTLTRSGLRGVSPSTTPALRADARIVATINGHRGAAGASGLTWMYMLDPAGRAALTADAEAYQALRGDPPVWFGVRRFLLGTGSHFTPFAVDNSRLLPPTSPLGRSEDALFNALLQVSHGDALLLDTPYSIGHVQEGRRDRDGLLGQPETPDINLCFAELARHVASDLYSATPAPRLALFAARLDDLAGGSETTTLSYLREYLSYRRSAAVEQLQAIDAQAGAAALPQWRADLRALIETNGRAVAERGPPRFAGWSEQAGNADCVAAFRHEAGLLADGMRAWPAAWDVALAQREHWLDGRPA